MTEAVDIILHQRILIQGVICLGLVAGPQNSFYPLILRAAGIDLVGKLAVFTLLAQVGIFHLVAELRFFGVEIFAESLDLLVFALLFRGLGRLVLLVLFVLLGCAGFRLRRDACGRDPSDGQRGRAG